MNSIFEIIGLVLLASVKFLFAPSTTYALGYKKFSKKNRIIVWFKNDFGLLGITLVLGFASIPIVSLLAAKYYRHLPITIYALLASTVVWAFLLTGISVWLIPFIRGAF
jgi:hypothetical protein